MKNVFILATALAIGLAQGETATWTAAGTESNYKWSDSTYWSPGVPADGDDALLVNDVRTLNLKFDQNVSLNSLVYRQPESNYQTSLTCVSGKSLSLGAGGFTVEPFTAWKESGSYGLAAGFYVPVTLTASQTWTYDIPKGWGSFSQIQSDISGGADVLWKLRGRHRIQFGAGSSENFLGRVEANLFIYLNGPSQASRLGKAGATITTGEIDGTPGLPGLFFDSNSSADLVCETPLTIYATNTLSVSTKYKPCSIDLAAVDPAGNYTLRFTNPLKGIVDDKKLLFSGYSLHPYDNPYQAVMATSIQRRDAVRIILDQDNSELVAKTAGSSICLSMLLRLSHANALGTGNGALNLILYDGSLNYTRDHSGIAGVFASNGVSVAANLYTPMMYSNARFDRFVIGTDGPGTSVFSGEVKTLGTEWANSPGFRFLPDSNSTVRVTGKITDYGPLEVVGRGDTVLANGANSIPNDSVRIRGGRLILGAAGALGTAPVLLGDTVPNRVTVKAMAVSFLVNSYKEGVLAFSSEDDRTYNVMTFATGDSTLKRYILCTTVDGQTVEVGDRILVNSPYCNTFQNKYVWLANGIWERLADDANGNMRWKRVDWLDDVADFQSAYGLRVDVEKGTVFGGTSLYFANREDRTAANFNFTDCRLGFHEEVEPQPSCALLTDAPITVSNVITVTDNKSTGTATIGTLAAGKTTYAGPVKLERDVCLTAPAGATVVFDGGFTGTGDVIIDGEGANFEIATNAGDPIRYRVKHGTVTYRMRPATLALFHLDPTETSTMTWEDDTYASQPVTNVLEWTDVRGETIYGKAEARPLWDGNPKNVGTLGVSRRPVYRRVETATDWIMPVVDTHDAFFRYGVAAAVTNSTAIDFVWADGTQVASYDPAKDSVFKHIRQAYVIAKDNVAEGADGMSFLGTSTSRNYEHFQRGSNGCIIAKPGSNGGDALTESVVAGRTELDGVRVADVTATAYPAGFHLLSFAPTGDTWVATLATFGNGRRGGLTYGEVILFTNELAEVSHQLLTRQLMNKWLNAGVGTDAVTNELACLALEGGTSVYEGIGTVRTGAVEADGEAKLLEDLVLDEEATIDVTYLDARHCSGVTGLGTLALPARATVRVTIPAGLRVRGVPQLILGAEQVTGDITGWTLETPAGSRPFDLRKDAKGVWLVPRRGVAVYAR